MLIDKDDKTSAEYSEHCSSFAVSPAAIMETFTSTIAFYHSRVVTDPQNFEDPP